MTIADRRPGSLAEFLAEPWARKPLAVEGFAQGGTLNGPLHLQSADVLLVGLSTDEHLLMVATELQRRAIPTVRHDVDRPLDGRLSYAPQPLQELRSVLVRATTPAGSIAHHYERTARFPDVWRGLDDARRPFAETESRAALLGWLASMDADTWVNHPVASFQADLKPVQLRVAAAEGLPTPRTLVTDSPFEVRAFADTLDGRLIYKSLDDPFVWQRDDRASFLYTNALTPADLSELDDRLLHPGLFQEQLKAVAELRVTVVGQRVFAARTTAIEGIDWRRGLDSGVPFTRVTLDPVLEAAVVRTVAALGLSFAAVDLLETVDNTYFLEANSCGAWSWLEKGLGLPVTSALVDLLATS